MSDDAHVPGSADQFYESDNGTNVANNDDVQPEEVR